MARLTNEDCIDKVSNRFELVALASQRAKVINSGGAITVDRDNDKDAVVALREIAKGNVTAKDLRAAIIRGYQVQGRLINIEEVENEATDPNENMTYLTENMDLYVNQEDTDLEEDTFDDKIDYEV